MIVGYIMNTYPMISTTFIGREIAALEQQGLTVRRYSIRRWRGGELVDPGDINEQSVTRYLLTGSQRELISAVLFEILFNPIRSFKAFRLATRLLRSAGGGVIRHTAYLVEAMALRRRAARDGVTHFHAHFSTNSTCVAMLAEVLGGPSYSFTLHGPDEFFIPFENSLRLKITRARFVACISHFCRSQAMLFCDHAHWSKLKIVHCGVNPANYGRRPHDARGQQVLFVGRLAAAKGVPLLLDAFAALFPEHPKARLAIIGDGPDRKALEVQAARLGIAGAITFLGFQPQEAVAQALEAADMLVLPSFAEGLPVVLMEAMASRIPVIAAAVAGVPELVEDGVSGFVVPPGDLPTLTERLRQLLADPDLCAQMGAAGRTKVISDFDVEKESEKIRTLFAGGDGAY